MQDFFTIKYSSESRTNGKTIYNNCSITKNVDILSSMFNYFILNTVDSFEYMLNRVCNLMIERQITLTFFISIELTELFLAQGHNE